MSSIDASVAAQMPSTAVEAPPPQINDEVSSSIAMDLKRRPADDASNEVAAPTTTTTTTMSTDTESESKPEVVVVVVAEAGAQVSDAVAKPCVERDFTQIDSATATLTIDTGAADVISPPTEEEDDHLSPLMMDNHTVTEHQELFKPATITRLADIADRVHEIPEFRPAAAMRPAPAVPLAAPRLRDCDPGQSMGSMDSDVSSSSSDGGAVSAHRSSADEAGSSTSAKDSGCDVGSAASSLAGDGTRRDSSGSVTQTEGDLLEPEMAEDTTPIEQPSDELAAQIVAQVQFYFSNENILKDAFLLKHVRRNKEGFVSLKLISSFKRVRQLTKDWRVVGVAIKRQAAVVASPALLVSIELNDVGTKVRRCEPLPVFDETMPSRTVVATDLPVGGRLTIESVSELFGKCGEIALIRILRPGGTIPADVRQFYNKHPELHERECALVEFTESQAARVAQDLPGMQTFEMVAPKKKTGKKAPGGGIGGAGGASVSRIVESYRYPSYADAERSRGGDMGGDFKYGLRRGSAGYFVKYHDQHVTGAGSMACHHRRQSYGNALNGGGVQTLMNAGGVGVETSPVEHCSSVQRRLSNCSIGSGGDLMMRKISNCSDGYCPTAAGSEMSRRTSACSQDSTRRASQCSMGGDSFGRRQSQCSADFCPCGRRASAQQCTDMVYRRPAQQPQSGGVCMMEHGGGHQRYAGSRRVSFDGEFAERKLSNGPFYGFERKLSSGGFEAMRKLSAGDKFYDARKMSADSGYDRRSSLGSLGSEHRCMTATTATMSAAAVPVLVASGNGVAKPDAFVRTPIGPDGSKGFSSRARKVGQVVGPV